MIMKNKLRGARSITLAKSPDAQFGRFMNHTKSANQASSAKNASAIEKCPTVVGIGGQICSLNTYGVCGRGHVCSPTSPKEEPRRQPSMIRSRRPSNVPLDSGVRYRTWKCVGGLRPRGRASYGRSPVVRRTAVREHLSDTYRRQKKTFYSRRDVLLQH